ncbi:MAG: Lrp/AsnC family transcriptional regulator [Eubacteriales bacterium]|nr:Lrp/AsnC family transcriptional regulator [Eubacteriales bacterium]
MDSIDRKILELLAEDSGRSAADMSEEVRLSVPAINKRISKMKETGIIKKQTVILDGESVGKPVMAFVMIELGDFGKSDRLLKMLSEDRDVLECYAVTGEFDYILKICASGIDSLETKLLEMKKECVVKSHTILCLREYKFEATPIPDEAK